MPDANLHVEVNIAAPDKLALSINGVAHPCARVHLHAVTNDDVVVDVIAFPGYATVDMQREARVAVDAAVPLGNEEPHAP